jgi:hypothetical protein
VKESLRDSSAKKLPSPNREEGAFGFHKRLSIAFFDKKGLVR